MLDVDVDDVEVLRRWDAWARMLLRSWGSQVFTAVQGWAWPASWDAVMAAQLLQAYLQANKAEGAPDPVVPMPWSSEEPVEEPVTVDELAAAREVLAVHSVF